MPLSVVVGGQYGSEGKGKIALHFAREFNIKAAVKVSGTNSGHTIIDADGKPRIHRVLPSGCVLPGVHCVIAPGACFQPELLLRECREASLDMARYLHIHPNAGIITNEIQQEERRTGLVENISSTGSGTGMATCHRILCDGYFTRACDIPELRPYITDTSRLMFDWIQQGEHILIEGGQGFGLSLYHTKHYPYCTSRDTPASAFIAEAGLSPLDVTNIIQVLRSYEIRVAGNSGPMKHEITWEEVTQRARSRTPIQEMTSVSKRVRRVGEFDPELVRQANNVNQPNIIVMNFMDYIAENQPGLDNQIGPNRKKFLDWVAESTGRAVTHVGFHAGDVRSIQQAMPGQ